MQCILCLEDMQYTYRVMMGIIHGCFYYVLYSPYAKVLVKMSVRLLHHTMLQHKSIYYTTTTTRILFKIKLQCR